MRNDQDDEGILLWLKLQSFSNLGADTWGYPSIGVTVALWYRGGIVIAHRDMLEWN